MDFFKNWKYKYLYSASKKTTDFLVFDKKASKTKLAPIFRGLSKFLKLRSPDRVFCWFLNLKTLQKLLRDDCFRNESNSVFGVFLQRLYIINVLIFMFLVSCKQKEKDIELIYDDAWAYDGITELKRGDIIVKANCNFFPRTSNIEKGWGFGHAAIITKGASGINADSILANSMIFESHARPLPVNYQLREIKGYYKSDNPFLNSDSFSPKYTGSRYRLRLDIPDNKIDSIIEFVLGQKGSYSSWNAMKRFPKNPEVQQMVADGERENWARNSHWYCSLLIWQSVYYITGIDLDANGGYFVYPNDLISSPYFDNNNNNKGRTRF